MNFSQIQDLQVSLQSKQKYYGNGQGSLKTLGHTAGGSPLSTSPVLTGRTSTSNNNNKQAILQVDGLGTTFTSMPTNHPLRDQMDDGVLGSQSLLLARYASLLINKKGLPPGSPPPPSSMPCATSSCFAPPRFGTTTTNPNNYGKKSPSPTTILSQPQESLDFLTRMLLLATNGQFVAAAPPPSSPSSLMADLQGIFSPRYTVVGSTAATNKTEPTIERDPPFPEKLHRLLRDVEYLGRSDVISFVADDTFRIHDPVIFFHDVLPQYFRQTKLSSFKRQLKLYGFELVTKGPTIGGYRHKLLSRKDPTLCREMKRVAIKSRQPSSTTNEDIPCTSSNTRT